MKNMTLKQIADACGAKLCRAEGKENTEILSAGMDSREAEDGFLFFAIKGERVDGHSFIPEVEKKGAACVICETAPQTTHIPYILVENSLQALKDVAEYYRQTLDITVVGITGSVGKTSTKEFVAGVLEQRYRVLKTQGNFNNEIGLPLTILKIRQEHEVAVIEMGISEFGEMHRLSKIARPDICVLTNIGQCHLENLKTREGILKAKSEIFDFMNPYGYVVVNGDDDLLAGIEEIHGQRPIQFGLTSQGRDAYATDMNSLGLFGSDAILHMAEKAYPVHISLPGQHMVYNALAAACVARLLDLSIEEIQTGIEAVAPVNGRSHILRCQDKTIIDDCYNANPVSMKAAIDLLSTANGRKVAILGDMFELGADEKALHAQIGSYTIQKGIDVLLCVGNLSRNMYDAALQLWDGAGDVRYYENKEELKEDLERVIQAEDTILIKASHGMHFEELIPIGDGVK